MEGGADEDPASNGTETALRLRVVGRFVGAMKLRGAETGPEAGGGKRAGF